MNITENVQEDVNQVYLDGRFDANTSGAVEQHINTRIQEGVHRFILNLEKVQYIASAGLRVILATTKILRQQHDGDLRIACLQPNVARVFEISGLNNVLRIFENMETAMQNFSE